MKVERERRNKSWERVKKQKEADKIHVECNYRGSMKIRVRI